MYFRKAVTWQLTKLTQCCGILEVVADLAAVSCQVAAHKLLYSRKQYFKIKV